MGSWRRLRSAPSSPPSLNQGNGPAQNAQLNLEKNLNRTIGRAHALRLQKLPISELQNTSFLLTFLSLSKNTFWTCSLVHINAYVSRHLVSKLLYSQIE